MPTHTVPIWVMAFTAVAPSFLAGEGVWIGSKVDPIATGYAGWAAFDYFRFS